MAVFGVIPRSFYEFETANLTAVNGAADRDLTVFETAMRLRQIALNAVQQAIQEDRLARASHTRPHQLDLSQLVPGTTTVDLHRDGTWRGPAVLLEVDQSEGTATRASHTWYPSGSSGHRRAFSTILTLRSALVFTS